MTITVFKKQLNNNTSATITANKDNEYKLLVYHDNGSGTIQNNDIIANKTYYAMIDAKNAFYRLLKKEMLYIID